MGGQDAESVEALVRAAIPNVQHLTVEDLSDGCGDKFHIVCVTDAFEGKALLERHRMIHDGVGAAMQDIHALTLKTWTVKQYESKKAKGQA